MGKKRKASSGPSEPKGPREYNPADARLGPISSYQDVADSEDEYFMNKDQILFDNAPKSKKQKRQEEEEDFLENSDEEALDYEDEGSEDDEKDDQDDYARKATKSAKSRRDDGSELGQDEEEEGDSGWWGSSRKEYYNTDNPETEADALEEEQEARRLQKKKLAKMSEADFIFDEAEWLAPETEEADQDEVVTEVLKDVEIPADMSPEDKYRLLKTRYPEFDYLADELQQLQPLLVTVQKEAEGQPSKSLAVVKHRILGCYVATLAMYFATLTSPARDTANGTAKALDPAELRDHEVMGALLECRDAWKKVEHLKASNHVQAIDTLPSPPEEETSVLADKMKVETKHPKKSSKESAFKKEREAKAKAKAERKAKAIEESLADLDALVSNKKKTKKSNAGIATRDSDSDFGEEEVLDAKAAAEKAARKKSLRFYTSQIVQKANRRADAGRDAGGDMDIPYRERLKDRQARLNAEAEKRGKKSSKLGTELGDNSDEEDTRVANAIRDDEDEYYDMVAARTGKKKEDKAARAAALAAASSADRVVETEEIGEDGKRKISYQIQKNKGLAPRRKKDVRNPRVKKRKAYAEKQKKLKSMKPVYGGGEGKGGYGGELTGIKAGLIKSVRL
ncbi:hypothetical protein M426DRAFT_325656 [Hypoxylon sp. CI-4A]|nr:hypothetical protein M426DRAFT_325656 [Hypoxylon sp. CI-4A]